MAYIGFDLDETLGRFSVVEPHSYFLQPHNSIYRSQWSGRYGTLYIEEPSLSETLLAKINQTFDKFIECLAEKEKEGLGLLRPGIVEIARRLYQLKQTSPPQVKAVVIYSNNGNLAHLHLAGKLIERLANAPGLFCNYVHWYHPSRTNEITWGRAGMARKTYQVLLEAFQRGTCPRAEIDADQVYFFDDVMHRDIYDIIGDHYIQNPAYKVDAEPVFINECFQRAFEETELDKDPEYIEYITPIANQLTRGKISLSDFLTLLRQDQANLVRKTQRPNNTNFRRRFNQTFPAPPISRNRFQKSLQTLRKLEQKQNIGKSLSSDEERLLTQSKNLITTYESQNPSIGGSRSGSRKTRKQRRRH